MDVSRDFCELLEGLNAEKARYLIVGAHAVGQYAQPRFTKDHDVWIDTSAENAKRVWRALKKFGAPLKDISPEDFRKPDMVLWFGIAPHRIDIIMGLDALDFDSAWRNRFEGTFGGVPAHYVSYDDLLLLKRSAGRPQDLLDIDKLKRTRRFLPKLSRSRNKKKKR